MSINLGPYKPSQRGATAKIGTPPVPIPNVAIAAPAVAEGAKKSVTTPTTASSALDVATKGGGVDPVVVAGFVIIFGLAAFAYQTYQKKKRNDEGWGVA